ncbi:hypothetical protein [Cellulomonas marina]|uniref:Outer membrane lipoprotein-sorting protein n=1 Tax=Cellulomonas marina TaxID=988821 RepID=A0A1I0V4E7_9CELL|nr:hypothetical protein [Cellulomonas marina]GIG28330.1 hypothetical protein Cma02nite_09300 [Cellulomonas marina]SFA71219.1 hypothetical protein SAMN05421867_101156 [Cellulomonas marina]
MSPTPSSRSLSSRARSTRARWAVPVVAVAVVGGAVGLRPLVASAEGTDLPDVTVAELLEQVSQAESTPVSGTVVYTARLGLPSVPVAEMSGADPTALLGGSSTLRVWTDGVDRSRIALLGAVSEYSVVRDGADAWTYSSTSGEAVHYTLDEAGRARYEQMRVMAEEGTLPTLDPAAVPTALPDDVAGRLPAELAARIDAELAAGPGVTGELPTPQEAARAALRIGEAYSTFTMGEQKTVAGRQAYEVVVTPKDDATLVDRVVVDVDGSTFVPLRVQVWSTQDATAPALELGFTDVSYATPGEAVLTFSPPSGTQVREVVVPTQEEPSTADGTLPTPRDATVTGEGWSGVVELQGVDVAALVAGDPTALLDPSSQLTIGSETAQDLIQQFRPTDEEGQVGLELDAATLYDTLTTPVEGGRLLSSALVSVLVTDDGRVLVGAVPADTLRALA